MGEVTKINVGAGKTKGIQWPQKMTILNRAQVPITITGQLARAGQGSVQKQAAPQMPVFLSAPVSSGGAHGDGFIKAI